MNKDLHLLSDREILNLIYTDVQDSKDRLETIEKDIQEHKKANREIEVTLYGDEKRSTKGVVKHLEDIREFINKYKKWEFAILTIIGLVGGLASIVWAVFVGIKELIN